MRARLFLVVVVLTFWLLDLAPLSLLTSFFDLPLVCVVFGELEDCCHTHCPLADSFCVKCLFSNAVHTDIFCPQSQLFGIYPISSHFFDV